MKVISKYLFGIIMVLMACTGVSGQVYGDYDNVQRAKDSLIADQRWMKSNDTIVDLLDVSFHQWSADGINFRKTYNSGDRYIRLSNNSEFTWVKLDLLGLEQYWVDGADSVLYVNTDYANRVMIDTTAAPSNFNLWVNGDVSGNYYFLGEDSLSHTNLYNGGATEGYVLVASGNTATWQPAASGVGETNLMANVGTRGVGVYDNKNDTLFEMRNIASLDPLLKVTLNAADSVIDLDLSLPTWTAGVGLSGGGSLELAQTINLSVPSLTYSEYLVVDDEEDWVILYDQSGATHYRVHPEDLFTTPPTYSTGDGLSELSNTFYLDTPDSVTDLTVNEVSVDGHTHAFLLNSLTSVGDVTDSPTSGQYLTWNGSTWVTGTPSAGTGAYVDLYVDGILRESQIDKINLVGFRDIKLAWAGDGEVKISFDWDVTEYSSTSVAINPASQTRDAIINISGDFTTVTFSNLIEGMTGNMTINGDGSADSLSLVGYDFRITPCLNFTGDTILIGTDLTNVYSWWYDGEKVFINGTEGYE